MQNIRVAGLEWDEGNWPKCGKHGVTRTQIQSMFTQSPAIYPDPAHSTAEERFLAIGTSGDDGRFLFVAFTLRTHGQEVLIRPIHALRDTHIAWATPGRPLSASVRSRRIACECQTHVK